MREGVRRFADLALSVGGGEIKHEQSFGECAVMLAQLSLCGVDVCGDPEASGLDVWFGRECVEVRASEGVWFGYKTMIARMQQEPSKYIPRSVYAHEWGKRSLLDRLLRLGWVQRVEDPEGIRVRVRVGVPPEAMKRAVAHVCESMGLVPERWLVHPDAKYFE